MLLLYYSITLSYFCFLPAEEGKLLTSTWSSRLVSSRVSHKRYPFQSWEIPLNVGEPKHFLARRWQDSINLWNRYHDVFTFDWKMYNFRCYRPNTPIFSYFLIQTLVLLDHVDDYGLYTRYLCYLLKIALLCIVIWQETILMKDTTETESYSHVRFFLQSNNSRTG